MSHTTKIKSVAIRSIPALEEAVRELNANGVRCELKRDAVPRLYYSDQLRRHLGRKSEVADYVLHIPQAQYDVAFIREGDGPELTPVFDNYGHNGVKNYLGNPVPAGATSEDRLTCSLGKLLQAYTKAASIEAAVAQGYSVLGTEIDAKGKIQLTLAVY